MCGLEVYKALEALHEGLGFKTYFMAGFNLENSFWGKLILGGKLGRLWGIF